MNILSLPDCVLEIIFSYLTYDDVAKNRESCRKFNDVGKQVLNHGFSKLLVYHQKHMKRIKEQLPRRESERRNHALSKHSDVLTCIETRLSMLSMTYQKHIHNGTACFIPGRIIDECQNIIRRISSKSEVETKTLKAHEILQELRDISSMAIEHFDEKIVPEIRRTRTESSSLSIFEIFPRTSVDGFYAPPTSSRNSSFMSIPVHDSPEPRRMIQKKKPKLSTIVKMYKKQSKLIKSQSKAITKMVKSLKEQKSSLISLKRRLDESEVKNRELSESIKKFKVKSSPKVAK